MKRDVIKVCILAAVLSVVAVMVVSAYGYAFADEMYIMCDCESFVNARNTPGKAGEIVGRYECGDMVQTDGRVRNGFIHVIDCPFEQSEAWVKAWYLTPCQPYRVNMTTVVKKNRTIARNGIGGNVIRRLKEGTAVTILVYTPEWCLTDRGYIRTEFLGVNR